MPDVTDGLEVVVACSCHSPDVAVERQTAVQYHTEVFSPCMHTNGYCDLVAKILTPSFDNIVTIV